MTANHDTSQNGAVLRAEGVRKVHPQGETDVVALRGVDCAFAENSFNFILGPSGSGKSSLLYLLGALDLPTSGQIIFRNRSLSDLTETQRNEYRRNDVGFIFQSFNLLKTLDAVDNVLVPFLPQGISRELRADAVNLLQEVGLGDRLDHRPSQLSGGEQQRVAIARALLKKPKVVLADEPTGELDSATGAEVFRYLRDLHTAHNTTVVVVTHDERYLHPGDRLLHLRDGEIEREETR